MAVYANTKDWTYRFSVDNAENTRDKFMDSPLSMSFIDLMVHVMSGTQDDVMVNGKRIQLVISGFVFLVLLLVEPQKVSASTFKSCAQLKSAYSNVIARSVADKSRFTSKDSFAAQAGGGIAVKPRVYRANSSLDSDRDGLLCEDDLEMAVNFVRVAELFKGMLNEGSSSSLNGWGNCSFRGKNMWGSVYISDNRFSSDFVVYRSTNSFRRI